jgi:SnoaL-like domain
VSREQKVAVVDAYLDCFLTKDLSKVRFADDITFEGPRMPKLVGKQNVIGFLTTILPMIKGIRLKQHIVEGDYVATVFDMETTNGVDHVFDRIQVVDEEIKGIQVFYYPQQP